MELTEDERIKQYGTLCKHCGRNTLLPNEYEFTCISCRYNVIKRKHEFSKNQRKTLILSKDYNKRNKNILYLYRCIYKL